MSLRVLRSIWENQKGFTLIEVVAILIITGLIGAGTAVATIQVMEQGASNSSHTAASRQATNAVHWISRDVQMAQILEDDPGPNGFPLKLEWKKWDNSAHEVVYTLQNNKISRSYSVDGGAPEVTLIAQYINEDPGLTKCTVDEDDYVVTLIISSSVVGGDLVVNFTKEAEISARPHL